ncbi:MAG: hypothetical protein ACOCX5_02910 [Chloroflexota bacterium]
MRRLRNVWLLLRWLRRVILWGIGILLFTFLVQRSTYPIYLDWNAIAVVTTDYKFDYLTWEIEALGAKAGQALWGRHAYMDEAARSQFVRDYVADLAAVRQLEAQIDAAFLEDPQADLSALQAQRERLRSDLQARQTTAESILEDQVAAVLVDEGFGTLGQVLPPVSMRLTRMPVLLVVSPRDRIARHVELALDPMTLPEAQALERRVEQVRDVSALVVPLGGMALFPAMIQESTSIPWLVETFAHEWIHHYFFFFPLGLSYFVDTGAYGREAVIINETVADIFGREIAREVLAQYYPEFPPPEDPLSSAAPTVSSIQDDTPPPFDFGAAMHKTRVIVDNHLARVQAVQAVALDWHPLDDYARIVKQEDLITVMLTKVERYMEHRRQIFWDNGYRIRKLNQAYFAFYGGYQGGIPGIGGEDPIGPAVRDIRAASRDLHAFIVAMRGITSRDELLAARQGILNN